MYDEGVSVIYAGGNDECNAVSDATWNYSYENSQSALKIGSPHGIIISLQLSKITALL